MSPPTHKDYKIKSILERGNFKYVKVVFYEGEFVKGKYVRKGDTPIKTYRFPISTTQEKIEQEFKKRLKNKFSNLKAIDEQSI